MSRRLSFSFSAGLLVVALATVVAPTASADPTDSRAWAQRLFEEGRALRRDGKIAEACERFGASQKLEPAVGTLLNYGDCSEKLDRLATAWATYKDAAALARVKSDVREKQAVDAAARLEPRLSHLTIRVAARVADLVVKRGEDAIPDKAWGIALPVDGGTYTIRAQAPEHVAFETRVVIPSSQGAVVVDVPALARDGAAAAAAPASPAPAPAPAVARAPVSESKALAKTTPDAPAVVDRPTRVPAFVALGVGLLGIGAGTFFAVRASDRWSTARSGCDATNRCTDSAYDLARDAHADGNIATAGFVVGAAGVAAGAFLWFLLRGTQP